MNDQRQSPPPPSITPQSQITPFGKMDTNGNIFPVTPNHHDKYLEKNSGDNKTKRSFKPHSTTPGSKGRRSRSVPVELQEQPFEWKENQERPPYYPGSPKRWHGHNGKSFPRRQDDGSSRGRGDFRRKRDFYSQSRTRPHSRGELDQIGHWEECPAYNTYNGYYQNGHVPKSPRNDFSMRNAMNHQPRNRRNSETYAQKANRHRNNGEHRASRVWVNPQYVYPETESERDQRGRVYRSRANTPEVIDHQNLIDPGLDAFHSSDLDNRRRARSLNNRGLRSTSHQSGRQFVEGNQREQRLRLDHRNLHDIGEATSETVIDSEFESILDQIPSETLIRTVSRRKKILGDVKDEMAIAKHLQMPINFKLDFLNEIGSSRLNPKATEFHPVKRKKSVVQKERVADEVSELENLDKVDSSGSSSSSSSDEEQVRLIVDVEKLNQNTAGLIDVSGFHYPVTVNQPVYTQCTSSDNRNTQMNATYPSLQNTSAPVIISNPPLISNPPQTINCFPQPINYQNETFNVNSNVFETAQNAVPSPVQYPQDLIYHPTYMPTMYPNASDSTNPVIYAAPFTPTIAPYQTMTPMMVNHAIQTPPLQTIYDGQQLVSLPSAPNPVMTRMEMPTRQAHTDPQTSHPGSQQYINQPPIMNLQAYCLTMDRDQPMIPKGVKVPEISKYDGSKPLLDRVGETLKEVRQSLKKKSKKCESREIWEEIIMKLIKLPRNYEPKELHSLKKYVNFHAKQAQAVNGKPLTNLELFHEIVDLTWPFVSQDINSPHLNRNLLNIVCNKNPISSNNPVKEARLQSSRVYFLKIWCTIALEGYNMTKKPKTVNEPVQRQEECRSRQQPHSYHLTNRPSERVNQSQEEVSSTDSNSRYDSTDSNSQESNSRYDSMDSNSQESVSKYDSIDCNSQDSNAGYYSMDCSSQVSNAGFYNRNSYSQDSNYQDSNLGYYSQDSNSQDSNSGYHSSDSNTRYNGVPNLSTDPEMLPFEEVSDDSDKDCDKRRNSLRGVSVGNRISYFESNTKASKPLRNSK